MALALKFGRKPAVHNERTKQSGFAMDRALAPLGAAPAVSNDYVAAVDAVTGGNWQMLGNDQWGDCCEADDGHYLMLRTANQGPMVIPTTAEVLALYSAETGFDPSNPNTDQGTDEVSDCEFMVNTGLLGHKAESTAFVDPHNENYLKWCIQLFGGCKFGINFPQSAMDQFNAGQPWTVVANDGGIIGGHDVVGVKYDGTYFYVVTWGKLQAVSPAWIDQYADEAHVLLFPDWIAANGASPAGFSLMTLIEDLKAISFFPTSGIRRHHRRRLRRLARENTVG
jgi:hypothetical protein